MNSKTNENLIFFSKDWIVIHNSIKIFYLCNDFEFQLNVNFYTIFYLQIFTNSEVESRYNIFFYIYFLYLKIYKDIYRSYMEMSNVIYAKIKQIHIEKEKSAFDLSK